MRRKPPYLPKFGADRAVSCEHIVNSFSFATESEFFLLIRQVFILFLRIRQYTFFI